MSLRKRIQELAIEQDVTQEVGSVEVNEDAPAELQEAISDADKEIAIQEEADLVASNIEEVQGGIQATLDSGEVSDVDVAVAEAHLQQIAIRCGFADSLTCENITYYNFNAKCEESLSLESYNYASNNREKLENINLALEGMWSSIKKTGSDILTWIKNLLKKLWNWITGWFKPKGEKVVKEIKEVEAEVNRSPEAKKVKEDIVEMMKSATDWSEVERQIEQNVKQYQETNRHIDALKHFKAMKKYLVRPMIIAAWNMVVADKKSDINPSDLKIEILNKISKLNKFDTILIIDEYLESTEIIMKNDFEKLDDGVINSIRNTIKRDEQLRTIGLTLLNDSDLKLQVFNKMLKINSDTEFSSTFGKWLKPQKTMDFINNFIQNDLKKLEKIKNKYKDNPDTLKELDDLIKIYGNTTAKTTKFLNAHLGDVFKAALCYKHYLDTLAGKYDAKEQKKFDDFMMSDEPLRL